VPERSLGGQIMLRVRLFLTALILLLLSNFSFASYLLDRVVAVVNQEVITWSELYLAMASDATPEVKAMDEGKRRKIFEENEALFLEKLIDTKLQLQAARDLGIRATDDEITETIDNIKSKYSMSKTTFEESLKKEGFTYKQYIEKLREKIIINKIIGRLIKSKIVVTDEEVQDYINSQDRVEMAGSYKISQIFFKKPEKLTDKYEIDEKASSVIEELGRGASFAELAKKYSEDTSAGSGGDLGLIKKQHLSDEFKKAVSQLKPGDISRPFWTKNGLHIIKLAEEVKPADEKEVVEEVRVLLLNKLFMEKYNAWVKQLREQSFIEIRL
jgi:peptidyl-prolyl cis-trans isomerase SurA